MKKIVLLLGIMLSTYNIIYAQNFLNNLFGGENITKEISKKLNDAYELCIDINNIGSPEQIMKKANHLIIMKHYFMMYTNVIIIILKLYLLV